LSFFEELKRRNVVRVGIAYGVATWLLIQVTDIVFPRIGLPDSAVTLVIALLFIGFIPALILAWAFEMTPEGIKREKDVDRTESITPSTGKSLNRLIIAGLALIIVGMGVERAWFAEKGSGSLSSESIESSQTPGIASANEPDPFADPFEETISQQSVAVLPFISMSSGEDDGYFADGLTEEILNSLAALPELLVTARTSSFSFKDKNLPVQEIATTLGVDHIVEGSVRRSGERVRITAQLVRADDGFHLWSDTYDRTLEDIFTVQEDIATRIAETLDVVLNENKRQTMRNAGIGDVEAFIAYQKGIEAFAQAHNIPRPIDKLPEANLWFDHALSLAPDIANALYLRTDLFGHIIFDSGFGRSTPSQATLAKAHAEILSSLGRAVRASDRKSQRAMIDAERTLFTDNWTSLPTKIEAAFQANECTPTNWVASAALVFGWAVEVVKNSRNLVRCDPLNTVYIWGLIREEIWNMNAEAALSLSEYHLENVGYLSWVEDSRFLALQATGQFRDDPSVYDPNPEGSSFSVPRRVFIHALEGEIDTAREIMNEFQVDNPVDDMMALIIEASLGDRKTANEIASGIDAKFAGPFLLTEVVFRCYCGAPFDLDATPNFKARIEEAGFPWPPPTPIKYPAKDW